MRLQDAWHRLVPLCPGPAPGTALFDIRAHQDLVSADDRARAHADADAHRWRGLSLYNLSRATLRLARTAANREHFALASGKPTDKDAEPYLAVAALVGLRSRLVAEAALAPRDQAASPGDVPVPDHSLTIVAGREPTLALILGLGARGRERHYIAAAGERKRWRTAKVLDPRTGDALVEVRVPPDVRQALGLPPYVLARAIEYHRHGYPSECFLTSLLDPRAHPRHELTAIHSERWASLSNTRTPVTAARPVLAADSPPEVLAAVAWLVRAYNLVRAALLELAAGLGQEPARLDFARALDELGPDALADGRATSEATLARLRECAADLVLADPGAPVKLRIEPLA